MRRFRAPAKRHLQGWQNYRRLNSSGAEVSAGNVVSVTGFIPFKIGDVLRFKNVSISGTDSGGVQYFAVYNSSKQNIRSRYTAAIAASLSNDFELDSSGNWMVFDTSNLPNSEAGYNYGDAAFFRLSALGFGTNSIITVNDEIEGVQEDVGGGGNIAKAWVNTGLQFIPADYENRIIELEHAKTILSDRITEIEKQLDGSQNISGDDNSLPNECWNSK